MRDKVGVVVGHAEKPSNFCSAGECVGHGRYGFDIGWQG